MKKYGGILGEVGNTPVVELDFAVQPKILAKLDYLNPIGSIKDRTALYVIQKAEEAGDLREGYNIIVGSSGNQAIAVAMISAVRGYKAVVTVPDNISREKLETLQMYGAKVHICASYTKTIYMEKAIELSESLPNSFLFNQYDNLLNIDAHYATTGPEIWQQTKDELTHVIICMGSCGTIGGVSRYLKERNSAIQIIGVDMTTSALSSNKPAPYQTEGVGVDWPDGLYEKAGLAKYIDKIVTVTDKEVFTMYQKLATQHGLLVGLSSSASLVAAFGIAKDLTKDHTILVMFCDSGRAYLDKVNKFFNNSDMRVTS